MSETALGPGAAFRDRPQLQPAKLGAGRVFISYQPGVQPDEELAQALSERLRPMGQVYPEAVRSVASSGQVERELAHTDLVIVLISEQALQSELLLAQVVTAANLAREYAGRPRLVGVRIRHTGALPYPFSTYLDDGLDWFDWQSEADTSRLIVYLEQTLRGEPTPPTTTHSNFQTRPSTDAPRLTPPSFSAPLELPEGTMRADSPYYIGRPSDTVALETIREPGVTITIKGPRQMGKSSLLVRVAAQARQDGKRVALLDFQFFDAAALTDAGLFLRQFCAWLSYTLKLEDRSETYWRLPLGNIQRCTSYLEDYLLPQVGGPLVLAMDEVDKIFDTDFRSDFFGMLRGWHNRRYSTADWQRLDLVLVTSTEPYQLVANLNQSPFNVGQVIELEDFTPAQLHELNLRHGQLFGPPDEKRLLTLTGGQPYLVRRALYLVASKRLSLAELFNTAKDERGPFGDHLRYHLFRLSRYPQQIKGLWQALQGRTLLDEDTFFRLQGAGLLRREGRAVVPRCQLYADFFRQHLPALLAQSREVGSSPAAAPGPPTKVSQAGPPIGLSGRELEVLRLLIAGLTNTQIAQQLSITPGTVNVHLSAVYGKLGVSSRTAAIRQALDHKLV